MKYLLSLVLLNVLLGCADPPEAHTTKDYESVVYKVSDFSTPTKVELPGLKLCGTIHWAAPPQNLVPNSLTATFRKCERGTPSGPIVALQKLDYSARKHCGCKPKNLELLTAERGEYKINFTFSDEQWTINLKATHNNDTQELRLVFTVS